MKKTIYIIVLLFGIIYISACKKDKDETPAPTASNNSNTTPPKGALYAKVDGADWYVGKLSNVELTYVSSSGGSYGFGGYSQFDPPYSTIGVNTTYTTGVVSFLKYGQISAYYKGTNGTHYPAITGTMNITLFDTTTQNTKFKATFSFVTDTVLGKSYTVTEGAINL